MLQTPLCPRCPPGVPWCPLTAGGRTELPSEFTKPVDAAAAPGGIEPVEEIVHPGGGRDGQVGPAQGQGWQEGDPTLSPTLPMSLTPHSHVGEARGILDGLGERVGIAAGAGADGIGAVGGGEVVPTGGDEVGGDAHLQVLVHGCEVLEQVGVLGGTHSPSALGGGWRGPGSPGGRTGFLCPSIGTCSPMWGHASSMGDGLYPYGATCPHRGHIISLWDHATLVCP